MYPVNRLVCYGNEYDTTIKGIQFSYANSKHNCSKCAASKWAFNLLLIFHDWREMQLCVIYLFLIGIL